MTLPRKRLTPRIKRPERLTAARMKRQRGDRNAAEDAHIAYIAQLPCCVSGRMPVHLHHLLRAPSKRAGRDHRWIVPLAHDLHNMGDASVHALGSEAAFERAHGLEQGFLIKVAARLWEESQRAKGT